MVLELIKEKFQVYNSSERMDMSAYKSRDMLLYLVKFGSHLYGTATENSDTDYKGIYRPSLQNLALGKVKRTLSFSTGNDNSKNNAEDIDVELFSLPYWLELLKKGETIALDLLFSFTNKEAVVYRDSYMNLFFNHTDKLVDSGKVKDCAYIRYAKSQSIKYGLKGTRLRALERAAEYFEDDVVYEDGRIDKYMFDIVKYVDDSDYCDIKYDDKGLKFLYLCGKMHQNTTTVMEFIRRVNSSWHEYGHRARQAMESKGIDWKAISHCMRAIYQTQELLEHGMITYPLKNAFTVLMIKNGEIEWSAVEEAIEYSLELIESMEVKFQGIWDQEFVDKSVLTIYDLKN